MFYKKKHNHRKTCSSVGVNTHTPTPPCLTFFAPARCSCGALTEEQQERSRAISGNDGQIELKLRLIPVGILFSRGTL